jgi:hypothetical protein
LSVDQRPFHSAPLGHYARLSSLLGRFASQSSSLVPLHSVRVMSMHPEGTIGRLRYLLGGDRPSQTTPLALSEWPYLSTSCIHETRHRARVVFHRCLPGAHKRRLSGSHLSYADAAARPDQAVVKLHGVFLSCRGEPASSRVRQFRRALRRDSAQVVMPFVRVGTYPTRNFATLGPL